MIFLLGSTPSGGTGNYTYEWRVSNSVVHDEIVPGANQKNYTFHPSEITVGSHFKRIVKSGAKTSSTDWVDTSQSFSRNNNLAKTDESISQKPNNELIKVYPNPISDIVNFQIMFDKKTLFEINISPLNSITKEILVHKGYSSVGKNTISWNLPKGLNKGIYLYKITSRDNEIKVGKIILN